MYDVTSDYKWPAVTKADVKRLTKMLDDKMQIKMLRHYRQYEKGETYEVNGNLGAILLQDLFGYRVD